ncbi:MAG: hypothetical protein JWO36_4119 [Myxococcales bacterium]|nr:hypothetical protein [Myxococcales bacterium]
MTPFSFEHVFAAPSTEAVFAAYWDPTHQTVQDEAVSIARRDIVELDDRGDQLRRVSRVFPKKQLPALIRSLVPGQLHYLETAIWTRKLDEIAIDIWFGKRVHTCGIYRLERKGPDEIRRTYRGEVSVDIALVAGRIERGIVCELECSMPLAAACTQRWLEAHAADDLRSVAARA